MKKFLLIVLIMIAGYPIFSQCPFTATLTSTNGNCIGTAITVSSQSNLSLIQWFNGSTSVSTVKAVAFTGTGVTVAGQAGRGSAANQLNNPIAISVDALGNVYIVDRLNYRVQEWAPNATSGVTVAGGNGQGAAANQLSDPVGIFIDANKNIYIADFSNNRIQKWAAGAASGVTVAGGNGLGAAANQLASPTGVFVNADGNIFIADAGNNRIQEWAAGATSGITVAGGNGAGPAANQLSYPSGVFVDASGNIFIADEKNNRVQEWMPGATVGITVAGGNGAGNAPNQLNTPYNIFIDANGNIYVDDLVNARVQEWTPGASNGITVAGGNGSGAAANQLAEPFAVYVDSKGVVYVADYGNNRVQKWAPQNLINTTYIPTSPGTYTATVTNIDGCTTTTNPIIINPSVTPSATINQLQTNICAGMPATFSATVINGGSNPNYQWQVNKNNVGTDSSGYTNSNFNNGDLITCMVTSNAACASPATVTSDTIIFKTSSPVATSVSISSSATNICFNDSVTFTAIAVNGGNNPSYQWQVNGNNAGTDSSVFIANNFSDNDVVSCIMTSNAGCVINAVAVSNNIKVHVNNATNFSLFINASATTICSGDTVVFTATPTNAGVSPSFQWQVNGNIVGQNSNTFITDSLKNGDGIVCLLISSLACSLPVISDNIITMVVNPSPVINIGNDTIILPGKTVQFNPLITGNIINYQWLPATGLNNTAIANPIASPQTTTDYQLSVIADNGCKASSSINVIVYYVLKMPNAFTPDNNGINDVFRIPPSTQQKVKNFSVYNRFGERIFTTTNSSDGWNGTFNNKKQPAGTYVWFIEYTDLLTGKSLKASGTVLLIR